jgi:hypothetical protein
MNGDYSNQVQRVLRTAELYDAILVLIPEHTIDRIGETEIRGKLDVILSMGKIEGRLSATHPDTGPHNDRLIERWHRIVDNE